MNSRGHGKLEKRGGRPQNFGKKKKKRLDNKWGFFYFCYFCIKVPRPLDKTAFKQPLHFSIFLEDPLFLFLGGSKRAGGEVSLISTNRKGGFTDGPQAWIRWWESCLFWFGGLECLS